MLPFVLLFVAVLVALYGIENNKRPLALMALLSVVMFVVGCNL